MKRISVLFLLFALLLTGCTTTEKVDETRTTLRFASLMPINVCKPTKLIYSADLAVANHIYEGLMRSSAGSMQYGLAKDYEISPDGLSYTFHLRDSYYGDGTPVVADDFKRAIVQLLDPHFHWQNSFKADVILNARAIREGKKSSEELGVFVQDSKTLRFTLNKPTSDFLWLLSMPYFAPVREDATAAVRMQDCSGPFVLQDAASSGDVTLQKNPYYWDRDRIHLNTVEITYMPSVTQAVEAFAEGRLDMTRVADGSSAPYPGSLKAFENTSLDYIRINYRGKSLLKNRSLRLALNYAIDRQAYIQTLDNALLCANTRCVAQDIAGFKKSFVSEYPNIAVALKGDEKRAKECLRAALRELNLSDAGQLQLQLTVLDNSQSILQGQALIDQWQQKLGITVTLDVAEAKRYNFFQNQPVGDMLLTGWRGDYPDPLSYLEMMESHASTNIGGYHSIKFDANLQMAAAQSDPQIRFGLLAQAENLLLKDGALFPLQSRSELVLIDPKLHNFELCSVGGDYEFMYAYFTQ